MLMCYSCGAGICSIEIIFQKSTEGLVDFHTGQLILHFVTEDDTAEVARTWPSERRPISEAEAQASMVL